MAEKILFQTKLDEFSDTDKEIKGVIRRDEFGNVYKWVQNGEATSVTATVNGAACYEDTARNIAHIPTTAQLANLAGFWQSAVPGQSYGWIKCKGKQTVNLVAIATSRAAHVLNLLPANGVETVTTATSRAFNYQEVINAEAVPVSTATQTAVAILNCRL